MAKFETFGKLSVLDNVGSFFVHTFWYYLLLRLLTTDTHDCMYFLGNRLSSSASSSLESVDQSDARLSRVVF